MADPGRRKNKDFRRRFSKRRRLVLNQNSREKSGLAVFSGRKIFSTILQQSALIVCHSDRQGQTLQGNVYKHVYKNSLKAYLKNFQDYFAHFFDLAIFCNAICIGLDVTEADYFFMTLFIIEIILRMYAYGTIEFFSLHRFWNWFDFIITLSTVIATIVTGRQKLSFQIDLL